MKKGVFSKLIIAFVILANVFFTGAVLYVFLRTSQEPTVLIGSWFSFTTVEIISLAKIKRTKEENR